MGGSKLMLILAALGTIGTWMAVPEARCAFKLHMRPGDCRPRTPPPPPPHPRPPIRQGDQPVQMIRLLTETDLAGKDNWELDVMRNEIYARHGRGFDRDDLRRHFGQFGWYRPIYSPRDFDEGQLTAIQRTNAEFIRHYQQGR